MVDFRLTDQQRMLREVARKFVKDEVVPVRAQLDREPDPKKGFSWELLRKADKVGLRTLTLGPEDGGINADIITRCLVGEELATGDLGFAVCLDQVWKIAAGITHLCNEEQKKRFIPIFRDDPECVLSICITEPSGGSNYILPIERKDSTLQARAELRNGKWILNGTKHFISNAGLSKLYLMFVVTDRSKTALESAKRIAALTDEMALSVKRKVLVFNMLDPGAVGPPVNEVVGFDAVHGIRRSGLVQSQAQQTESLLEVPERDPAFSDVARAVNAERGLT